MASSRKKAIVRTLENTIHSGYLPLTRMLNLSSPPFTLDLLDLEGRLSPIPIHTVRTVAFVRDFNLGQPQPEGLQRRTFLARPRTEGLWLRLTLHSPEPNGELLEGLAPLDLALLDDLLEDHGLFLIPPDIRSNTQRLFVPRTAIRSLQIIAVITTPSRTRPPGDSPQTPLFPEPSIP